MTEEEKRHLQIISIEELFGNLGSVLCLANDFRYLLSKHFDLFGLIEAGLAIDKTKEAIHD